MWHEDKESEKHKRPGQPVRGTGADAGVVVRLSGTGTKGATIRVYLESYVPSSGDLHQDPQIALADMISSINSLAEIQQRTGMDCPTVIT